MIAPGVVASKPSPWDFYSQVLMPAQSMFRDVHQEGFVIDHANLASLDVEFTERVTAVEERMNELAGKVFNPRSPQQVGAIMFDDMGLRKVRKRSTDVDVLEKLLEETNDPFVKSMMSHRALSKQLSTYIRGIDKNIRADNRLHPEFLVTGAVSRTSSRNPNCQNIPRKGDPDQEGAIIKKLFLSPEGWDIAHLDYGQHEFRMVAVYSEDEWLTNVFASGGDMHDEVAREYYGDDYTKEDRVEAKKFNFGLLYQRGAYSLSMQINSTVRVAEERIEQFYARMPDVRIFIRAIKDAVLEGDDLVSLLGRHRRFGLITRNNRDDILKQAVNFLPQATGSDTAMMGMHDVWQQMSRDVIRPVGFIHDAMLAYVRSDVKEEVINEAAVIMKKAPARFLNTPVPFEVEAEVGPSWGDMKEVKLAA